MLSKLPQETINTLKIMIIIGKITKQIVNNTIIVIL
jgi:hypothetical protein